MNCIGSMCNVHRVTLEGSAAEPEQCLGCSSGKPHATMERSRAAVFKVVTVSASIQIQHNLKVEGTSVVEGTCMEMGYRAAAPRVAGRLLCLSCGSPAAAIVLSRQPL